MRQLILLFSFVLALNFSQAQGIDFFHGEWEEALELAKAQDKLIFVDAYATWCGPCKRMAANVFPDEEVGAFHNKNFVNLKIDMEAPENSTFASQYPVAAFPTLYYIDGEGKVVHSTKGALQAGALIAEGNKAMGLSEPVEDYSLEYENGNRDPQLVYKYVRSLILNGESHLKVANDFLRAQDDLTTGDNLQFILLAATEADSRIFKLMLEHKNQIITTQSKELFVSQVYQACSTTAKKAIEFSSHELLEEAWAYMDNHYSEKAESFQFTTEMDYTEAHYDAKGFAKVARDYAKAELGDRPEDLVKLSKRIRGKFSSDERAMKVATDLAEEAAKIEKSSGYQYFYANLLFETGDNSGALKAAEAAKELAEEEGATPMIQAIGQLIEKIQAG